MMLIYQQKPGANFVASRTAFKDMGYDLKPGQWRHPAWIIRPETKTLFVTADGVVADIKSATVQEKADIQDGKFQPKNSPIFGPQKYTKSDRPPVQQKIILKYSATVLTTSSTKNCIRGFKLSQE